MKLLYRGAEADVFKGEWCGRPAVYKKRKPLLYRHPELDRTIRNQRTIHEAQIMHQSKAAGVAVPYLFHLSPEESLLVMEFVEGERLKTLLLDGGLARGRVGDLGEEVGRSVAKLHGAGIMHGDLTTSNVIVHDGTLVLIDFGLALRSLRLEDQAVDLRLIKETLTGAHNGVSKPFMKALLEGYASILGPSRAESAAKKLAEIERRGRYARVE